MLLNDLINQTAESQYSASIFYLNFPQKVLSLEKSTATTRGSGNTFSELFFPSSKIPFDIITLLNSVSLF